MAITLIKRDPEVWPRLTESKDRLPWLRTDFHRLSEAVLKEMLASEDIDDFVLDSDSDSDAQPKTKINVMRPSPEEIVS